MSAKQSISLGPVLPQPVKQQPWTVVAMEDVPEPPSGARGGRYALLYEALTALPSGHSIRMPVTGGTKVLSYMKTQLSGMAKRDGKRLLSSRTADNSTAWFWLGPGKAAK